MAIVGTAFGAGQFVTSVIALKDQPPATASTSTRPPAVIRTPEFQAYLQSVRHQAAMSMINNIR